VQGSNGPGDSEDRLRRVVESAPLVLWSVDKDGIFTLSTGRALAHLGLEPGEAVGSSAFEMYRDSPEIVAALRRGLAGEEFSIVVEVVGRVFETRYTPLRDGPTITGLLGISIDITERCSAEREHDRLRAQLLQVQKLESLGILAGGIAHDFNNILTAILGSAAVALMTIPAENRARADIENIVAASRRAATLTRQMLAYSGKGHFEIRIVDLSEHVREIAQLVETTVPKKVQLRLELARNLPAIEVDVAQLQQVVMNLVLNGAEAIGDECGRVQVATGVQDIDAAFAASFCSGEGLAPGPYVFVEVCDTGCGMDDATQAKIFDPFFTTKFAGRGLGLAAVLGIVRAHNGAIKVHSSPGQGSTFKVFFPASLAAAASVAPPSQISYRGRGLVLVIDDDAGARQTFRRMLECFGFTVQEAADGLEGCTMFAARPEQFALVVVDMTMPNLSGEETFRELRRAHDRVPVILTSGYNEVEATRHFTAQGLAGFLEKPFTLENLARKLQAILPSA
jgi:two-component system cell cycle sensor histidine kinase/response regulator CckA